jgi:hypothetical protein
MGSNEATKTERRIGRISAGDGALLFRCFAYPFLYVFCLFSKFRVLAFPLSHRKPGGLCFGDIIYFLIHSVCAQKHTF